MNDELQRQVQEAIDELVNSGVERGLQVAVYHDGKQVVDAVAGVAYPAAGRPVTSDTPFFSYSIGKGVAATIAHALAERGALDYDTRIVELWPEFGAHGKETATIRHALSQSAGVPGLPPGLTVDDLCDREKMVAIIADETPWWKPGAKIGYHAMAWRQALEDVGIELSVWRIHRRIGMSGGLLINALLRETGLSVDGRKWRGCSGGTPRRTRGWRARSGRCPAAATSSRR